MSWVHFKALVHPLDINSKIWKKSGSVFSWILTHKKKLGLLSQKLENHGGIDAPYYRGSITEKYPKTDRKLNLPWRFVLTLNKTKTRMPYLKIPVTDVLKSNVVYKITCPQCKLCYIGQSARHILTRYKEHISSRGLLKKNFEDCGVIPSLM